MKNLFTSAEISSFIQEFINQEKFHNKNEIQHIKRLIQHGDTSFLSKKEHLIIDFLFSFEAYQLVNSLKMLKEIEMLLAEFEQKKKDFFVSFSQQYNLTVDLSNVSLLMEEPQRIEFLEQPSSEHLFYNTLFTKSFVGFLKDMFGVKVTDFTKFNLNFELIHQEKFEKHFGNISFETFKESFFFEDARLFRNFMSGYFFSKYDSYIYNDFFRNNYKINGFKVFNVSDYFLDEETFSDFCDFAQDEKIITIIGNQEFLEEMRFKFYGKFRVCFAEFDTLCRGFESYFNEIASRKFFELQERSTSQHIGQLFEKIFDCLSTTKTKISL